MWHTLTLSKMPPWTKKGGCLAAMRGKDCVVIATDYTTSAHQMGNPDAGFKKLFRVSPHTFMGLTGLQLDILAVRDRVMKRKSERELSQCLEVRPQEFCILLSNVLYKQRSKPYYVESIVAGLEPGSLQPFLYYTDWIGYRKEAQDYLVAGNCAEQLLGMCRYLWKPNLSPEELFNVMACTLYHAFRRNAASTLTTSGLIYIIEEDKITERIVET